MPYPAGFFSYVRFNDETEEGRLSELREKLEAEVSMLLGETFELFQDTKGVGLGQNWQKRLDEGLAESTLFIPILTPAYLKRQACRDELEKFLAKEKDLGRDDLVLPLVYLETPAVTDEARRSQDPLATALHMHQYRDWSDLRFEPWEKSKFLRLTAIAKEIVKALERKPKEVARASPVATSRSLPQDPRAAKSSAESDSNAQRVEHFKSTISTPEAQQALSKSKRQEPATLIVDPMPGRGEFTSIAAAIAAATGGERILVRPHVYGEAINFDKPVELIGDGKREEIIIEASGANVIRFQSSFGRVANLTIRQTGGGVWVCVDIPQGQLVIDDCDITSQDGACVAVHGGANPILRRNAIHDGLAGILFYENGKGTAEDNDFFLNKKANVQIRSNADPTLRRNRIRDGKQCGVLIGKDGKGTLEDNDIFENVLSGVEITENGNPVLRRNRIHGGKKGGGVYVYEGGKGTLEDNDIFGNALAGVQIKAADTVLRRNRIHDGKQGGVFVNDGGKGMLEDNDICGNEFTGVEIRERGSPILRQNRINKNKHQAIWIWEDGTGVFQDNDLRDNDKGPWKLETSATDIVREKNLEV
jgi:F-box protein 11